MDCIVTTHHSGHCSDEIPKNHIVSVVCFGMTARCVALRPVYPP